jgi:hypothetical protein
VRGQPWFDRAMATFSGQDFASSDIEKQRLLGDAPVATYSTAIRQDGLKDGQPLGVLAIFFDWHAQARAVVEGVKFGEEERQRARALLLDSQMRVIAASDGQGVLEETFPLKHRGKAMGNVTLSNGTQVGYARTPGYETYKGMGWYGVVVLKPAGAQDGDGDACAEDDVSVAQGSELSESIG